MPHGSVRKSTLRVHGHIFLCHPGHYFSLANDLIDHHAKTIGILGVGLYAALARYADRKTGECWPSIGRLANLLDCARSTIKIYLRKLEACGLITITKRWDEAGDSTSHLYTLRDPSPTAIDRRHAAHEAAVVAAPEGGRLPADPPPAACRPTGRLPADPKPSSPEHTKENHAGRCSIEQEEETQEQARVCEHAPEDRLHFGDISVCQHCWAPFDTPTPLQVSEGLPSTREGRQHPHVPRESKPGRCSQGGGMQKLRAWGLLALVLGLDGLAGWAMLYQHDLCLSLLCVAVNVGVLLASYHRWRWGS